MPRPAEDLLPVPERLGLLDSCFHPVLSFPDDVSQSLHYGAVMKSPEWQQKCLRTSAKSLKGLGLMKADKDIGQDRRGRKHHVEHRKKYTTSRLKKAAVNNTLTARIKRKLSKGRKPKGHDDSSDISLQRLKKRRQHSKSSIGSLGSGCADDMDYDDLDGSHHSSPVPSPCPPGAMFGAERLLGYKDLIRRKRENSYDIDNIVIPYSMAAATRVEKLPYKEIPTPKWRLADFCKLEGKNNGVVRRSSQEDDSGKEDGKAGSEETEDMSEETITRRHEICEVEEKRKFMSYMTLPHSGRSRHRRTDSRAESSGANTPGQQSPPLRSVLHPAALTARLCSLADPLSPAGAQESNESPITSPPATPLPESELQAPQRRRTTSQSRWAREEVRWGSDDPLFENMNLGKTKRTNAWFSRGGNFSAHLEGSTSTSQRVSFYPEFPPRPLRDMVPGPPVVPFEPRAFPLSDEEYEKMLKDMPEGHIFPFSPKKLLTKDNELSESSRPVTPSSDSTESAIGEGEDPNDPEWTVEEEKELERERLKACAKR